MVGKIAANRLTGEKIKIAKILNKEIIVKGYRLETSKPNQRYNPMRTLQLNEEQIKQLEALLGEVPNKWAMPIIQVLQKGLKEVKDEAVGELQS